MIKNYFKIAWRNLWRNKTFTFLNLGGLTISLAACFIIYLWVSDELNYDHAAANGNRVCRVALTLQAKGQPDKQFAVTAAPLAPVLVKDFPEIENAVRMRPDNVLLSYNNDHFFCDKFFYTDSTFFNVFGFPLLSGNPHTVLLGSNAVVVSEGFAKRHFGSIENAVGKNITCNDTILLSVAGVAKDIPANSHFTFDMVCSLRVLERLGIEQMDGWWSDDFYTYILLKNAAATASLDQKITNIMDRYNSKQNKELGLEGLHFLQPLKSIHLHSNLGYEINPNGNIAALKIFISIAVFLLLVACINYINLTTATSFKRAKEIGMRKVAGAEVRQLMAQFLSEAILIALIAMLLAVSFAALALPYFNMLGSTEVSFNGHFSLALILISAVFAFVLGIVAGIYPAFYLSRIQPLKVFKNMSEKKGSLLSFRKSLVVFQFTLAVILVVATIVAQQQLHYMQNQNLGFDKEQVLAIPLRNQTENEANQILKNEIKKIPGVTAATCSSSTPGGGLSNQGFLPEGVGANDIQTMANLVVDFDFINTYNLDVIAGRSFSRNFGSDSSAFILNETAVKEIGWGTAQNAIGKRFEYNLSKKGTVIGVVKDFHFNSLQKKIEPVVMQIQAPNSGWYGFLSIRLNTGNVQPIINALQASWKQIFPQHPLDYFFVDEYYNKQYQNEKRLSHLSGLFSALTIFISCLGLFALVMVAVSKRTKEIGVRKVLGASVSSIVSLLSKDFVKLVIVASIIAFPVAWWAMNNWLADFAYRIKIAWWVFVVAGFGAVLIALITVCFQAIRAAGANPVESLRNE